MTARKTSPTSSPQLAVAAEGTDAMLRGFAAMRQVDTDAMLQTASALEALPAFPFFPTWAGLRR